MSTYYVGLSNTLHDSALAIVGPGGRVLFAEATERYLQNKRVHQLSPGLLLARQQPDRQALRTRRRARHGAKAGAGGRWHSWSRCSSSCVARNGRLWRSSEKLPTSCGRTSPLASSSTSRRLTPSIRPGTPSTTSSSSARTRHTCATSPCEPTTTTSPMPRRRPIRARSTRLSAACSTRSARGPRRAVTPTATPCSGRSTR